jgi:hypothetical protein
MVSSSPASATVAPGQTANYTVAIAPDGGFNQTVSLTCTGVPAQSTCAVAPTSITLNGSASQNVTVRVTTTVISSGMLQPLNAPPSKLGFAMWLAWSGGLGLPVILIRAGSGRKARPRWLAACVLTCVIAIFSGLPACGGGSTSNGVRAGSYTLTVTGTFASGKTTLTHNTKLTLVVQ